MRLPHTIRQRSLVALISSALLLGLGPAAAMAQSVPTITGFSAGTSQSTLTITGTGFGTTQASVVVDGLPATVVSWSDSSVTVDLPAQAGPGTIDLTTANGFGTSTAFSGIERGYYTLSPSGQVSAHGNINTYGDLTTLGISVPSPAVQLVPTQDGQGYWILTQNGTVYGFGNAANFGSVGASITAVGMAPMPSGGGAYVLSSTGQVYTLGQAPNYGSPTLPSGVTATAIAASKSGFGYWVLGSNGAVYPFGDAGNLGSASFYPTYPNGTLVRVQGSNPVFLVENGKVYHIPTLPVLLGMGATLAQVKVVPNLAGYTLGNPMVVPYPDGTVLEPQDSSTVYLVEGGLVHPLSSPSLVQSDGIPQSLIQSVPTIEPNWPMGPTISSTVPYVPNGSLYRVSGSNAVYLLNNGALDHIVSGTVFQGMGFKWSDINVVQALPSYPSGPPLTAPVPLIADGTLWQAGHAVYVDQNGVLRHIPNPAMFNALGFSWHSITHIPSVTGLKVGSPLGSTAIPGAASNPPSATAVDLVPTQDSLGYWVLWSDGKITTVGDAPTLGQPTASQLGSSQAVSLTPTPDYHGYTVLASNGAGFSFGDALTGPGPGQDISLAMTPVPQATTISAPQPSGFFSMMYGSFAPTYDGSYSTMVQNAAGISAIVPTWFYEQQNPTTLAWSPGSAPSWSGPVVTQAHAEGVQVWPMVAAYSVGPFQTASAISTTVSQLVNLAVQNNYDGLTLDFEPSQFNGLSSAQVSQQYDNLAAQLGPALHAVGKKLMVDTYSAFYPVTIFNLSALAPYVDYINVMSYGHHDSYTEAGADASLPWMQGVYQNALLQGVQPSQLIMGFGPYGDYWSFNNSGLDKNAPLGDDSYVSDAQVQQLLQANPNIQPIWDPTLQSEVFMTNQYVNSSGQWTVNTSGQAVAPTNTFSTSDEATYKPQVQNLQGLLNYILLRYAVENNQPVPSYLNLVQDGHYGPITAEAVTQFQQDFQVSGATPGVYDAATQTALTQVIQQWNLGEYQYWVDTTQSMQNRVQQVALNMQLGGMSVWRLPFETSDFWSTLESTTPVAHAGQGGN